MPRYFIELAYNGSRFHGWQRQANGISVQEVLEGALSTLCREEVKVTGAGRTDAGVHAAYMVAHFDLHHTVESGRLHERVLNRLLPRDIEIFNVELVPADAHSRFSAIGRRYEYHVITSKNPFLQGLATRLNYMPDFELMNIAASYLLNCDDFTSFSKLHGGSKTNYCKVVCAGWERRGNKHVFAIEANRFTRNMVRAIVGTLLDVGRGKISIEKFHEIVEGKNRCLASTSVPADGLYLVNVIYPPDVFVPKRRLLLD